MVWPIGNDILRISEVILHWASLVVRWATISPHTIVVFEPATQANLAYHLRREYWPPLGKKRAVLHNSRLCYNWTAGILI